MKTQEYYNEEVLESSEPKKEDADLAHQLSSYTYHMKFNSDKFGEGAFKMF